MKILFAAPYSVYPASNGGKRRTFSLIKEMSKFAEIDLVLLVRNDENTNTLINEMNKYCKNLYIYKRLKGTHPKNIIKSLFSLTHPIQEITYFSEELFNDIVKFYRKYDIIYIETYYMLRNFEKIFNKIPIVVCFHNIDYLLHKRLMEKTYNIFMKFAIGIDILKIRNKEKEILMKFPFICAVSDYDINYINNSYNIKKDIFHSPNGVNIDEFYPLSNTEKKNKLLFVGDFGAIANEVSILHFIDKIFPRIKTNIEFHIVGPRISKKILEKCKKYNNIFIKGYVDNIYEEYRNAKIFVAPITVGSGTKLKLLEALSSGLPIITTSIGAEGLKLINFENCIITDNDNDFAKYIDILINEPALERKLSENARKSALKYYDWKVIAQDLYNYFQNCINNFITSE